MIRNSLLYIWAGALFLAVTGCPDGEPEQCQNGIDDDEDGAVDCQDSDCSSTTACELCGNGYLDPEEKCDGTNFGGEDCLSLGWAGGKLKCSDSCVIDTSGCTEQPTEICDNDVDDDGDGAVDCVDLDCAADPACGPMCGNAKVEPPEACDGNNLNGKTCASEGFVGGMLVCKSDCTIDTSGCGTAEMCNNAADDDIDGHVDCGDPDCFSDAICTTGGEVICDDFNDNDGDALIDCEDASDCQALAVCQPGGTPTGGACDSSSDCQANDSDPFCFDFPMWPDGYCSEFCSFPTNDCGGDAVCVYAGFPSGAGLCLDGCTTNADCRPGYTCQEPPDDNTGGLVCFPESEDCYNGTDDNNDGKADCADPSCDFEPSCAEDCGNGVDDDGDGAVDCQDGSCAFQAPCAEACNNDVDDNGDGLIDCQDPTCADSFACSEICDNNLDDDGNGLVDCDDPDCAGAFECLPPEICDNGLDDDFDGDMDCEDFGCFSDPACPIADACAAATVLTDGVPANGTTAGGTTMFRGFCTGYNGAPERLFSFTAGSPGQDGILSVDLSSPAALGVYIRGVCEDPFSELNCADFPSSLMAFVPGGSTVTIFVDTMPGAAPGPFTITATFVVPVCGNGIVEFGEACDPPDGVVCGNDCQFIPGPELSCNDLFDDDGDGLYDCQDPTDCQLTPECTPGATPPGGPCTVASDCMATGGDPFCVSEAQYGYPGGWCTEYCTVGGNDCSGDAICADIGAGISAGHCWDTCQMDGDCRAGYTCQDLGMGSLICWP